MSGVSVEQVLVQEAGQLGRFQCRVVAVAALVSMVGAFSTGEYLFTAARINNRCLIPECEGSEAEAEFSPSWILNAVPAAGDSFQSCQRFAPARSEPDAPVDPACPATLFDTTTTVACDHHVYQTTNTIVYDFDLGCDEWGRTLVGSVRTLGALVSLPATGFVSDRWGRRNALVFNAVNTAWVGLLRCVATTYAGFLASQFFESALGAGAFSCIYILLMEVVGPRYRVAAGAVSNMFFSVGHIVLALIAWALPRWQHLTLALYAPQLLTVLYLWVVPESIRWYVSKGRVEDAVAGLRTIARVNNTNLSEKSVTILRTAADKISQNTSRKTEDEPWLVVLVWRHKPVLLRCLVAPVWWITLTFIYYGLSINAVNMSGNSYVNYMAVSAVEIPGYWVAVLLINRVGRRPVLVGAYWVCAACQIGYIFLPDGQYALSLCVFLLGKFCIASVGTAVYVYTAELFPTRHRHSLFAFCSMMGRVGAIVAPLTPALGANVWEHLPFVLFAGLALVSGLLVLLTPETLGARLPDTMLEANQLNTNTDTLPGTRL